MEEISGLILPNAGQSGRVDVSMAFIALPLFFTPVFLHTLRVVNAQVGSHFSKLAEMRCPGGPRSVSKIRRRVFPLPRRKLFKFSKGIFLAS